MSDKSDTPRTHQRIEMLKAGHSNCLPKWEDFASQLERELNDANKALENSKAYKRVIKEDNARMRKEMADAYVIINAANELIPSRDLREWLKRNNKYKTPN